jgi:hypothetical protein
MRRLCGRMLGRVWGSDKPEMRHAIMKVAEIEEVMNHECIA